MGRKPSFSKLIYKASFRESVNEQGVMQTLPVLNRATAPAGLDSITKISVDPLVTVAHPDRHKPLIVIIRRLPIPFTLNPYTHQNVRLQRILQVHFPVLSYYKNSVVSYFISNSSRNYLSQVEMPPNRSARRQPTESLH